MLRNACLGAAVALSACAQLLDPGNDPNAPSHNPSAAASAYLMPKDYCVNRCLGTSGSSQTRGDRIFCNDRCTY
jgi:hypothetical protein